MLVGCCSVFCEAVLLLKCKDRLVGASVSVVVCQVPVAVYQRNSCVSVPMLRHVCARSRIEGECNILCGMLVTHPLCFISEALWWMAGGCILDV